MQFVLAWPAPERYPAKVVDLSPTGMQFVSHKQLQPKQRLKIESPTLSAIAVVSRCVAVSLCRCVATKQTSIYQTGVKFLTLRLHKSTGTFFRRVHEP